MHVLIALHFADSSDRVMRQTPSIADRAGDHKIREFVARLPVPSSGDEREKDEIVSAELLRRCWSRSVSSPHSDAAEVVASRNGDTIIQAKTGIASGVRNAEVYNGRRDT